MAVSLLKKNLKWNIPVRLLSSNSVSTESSDSMSSGWKPPSKSPQPIPFLIRRSNFNNLPVYLDYKNGRTRVFTVIKNIEGDIESLEKILRLHLKIPYVLSRVDNFTGQIILNGNFRNDTKLFLRTLGF